MKTKSFFMALAAISVTLWSCTPEEDGPGGGGAEAQKLTLSSEQIILAEENDAEEALTISWNNFASGAEYKVQIAGLYSVGWDNSYDVNVEGTSYSFTVKDLQDAIVSLGNTPGTDVYIKIMVTSGTVSTEAASAVVRLYVPAVTLGVPVITANAQAVTCTEATKLEKALELSWTDSAVESSACKYEIEFADATDTDFEEPIYTETFSSTSTYFCQLDLNIMLLNADYTLGQTSSLIYRIKAVPVNPLVKGSVSETQSLSVTSYTRLPAPETVESIYVAGSGVESLWEIPHEKGAFTNIGNGIWEWTGTINDQGGTFKVFFNGAWNPGFKHGDNDHYWEDAQITTIGDDDYGVVLAKGTYKLTVDVNKGTLSREIIQAERTAIEIMECRNWTIQEIPSINTSNTVFQGNVDLVSEDGFIVRLGDGNRNYVRSERDAQYGTIWKMSERRAQNDPNNTNAYWFHSAETKTYKVTIDIQNNTLTLE